MNRSTRVMRPLVPLAVSAALVLSACGGDDDDDTDTAASGGATTVEAAEPAAPSTEEAPGTSEAAVTTEPATTEPTTAEPATTEPAATDAAEAGFTYTSPEGDFSAVFAGEPTSETQAAPLPDGTTIDLVITGFEEGGLFTATARGQYPDTYVLDVPLALQGAQDQAIANVNGTLIASRDIELQGRPGREFSASVISNGVAGTVLQRVYLDGLVIYQAIAAGEGDLTFEDPELAAFFASFSFTTG